MYLSNSKRAPQSRFQTGATFWAGPQSTSSRLPKEWSRHPWCLVTMAAFLGMSIAGKGAEFSLTGTTYTQNFNGIGATATAALPTGWLMSVAGSSTPTYSNAGDFSALNLTASSGVPTTGGRYNWGSGTDTTDRAVGFMTSGGYATPNSILFGFTNNTGAVITGLTLGFDIERYRVNTTAASETFFISTDGTTWTAVTGGDSGAFATGTNAYTFSGGTVVSKAPVLSSLNIAVGTNYYLRWNFITGASNSQGLGLDNFTLSATLAAASSTYYWAPGGVLGGAGTWDGLNGNWSSSSPIVSASTLWDSSKLATFGGATAGTVQIDAGGISATKGLQFSTTGYTLQGGTLTLSNVAIDNVLTTDSGVTATLASAIATTGGFTKAGTGTLIVSGTNAYTGTTTISAGTLQMANVSALGNATNALIVNTGATLDLNGLSVSVGAFSGSNGVITSGIGGALTLSVGDGSVPGAFSGTIQNGAGVVSLSVQNQGTTGTVNLTGANTFTGTTSVGSGTLALGNVNALQATAGVSVSNGAQLQFNVAAGGTYNLGPGVLTLNGSGPAGAANGGALTTGPSQSSGTATFTNDVTFASDATLNARTGTSLQLSGKLSGSGALLKTGAGTLNLNGSASTGTGGTFITSGITNANGANVLMSGALTLAQGAATSATLNINENQSVGDLASTYSGTAGTVSNTLAIASGKTLTVTQLSNTTFGTPGSGSDAGKTSVISGSGGLALAAASTGTLSLDGSHTFTGGVAINGGELKLKNPGALNISGANPLSLAGTGKLTLNGNNSTVADLSGVDASTVIQNAAPLPATLTVNKGAGASTFAGTLQDGTGGGTLAVTKSGAGSLTLSGANTFSGGTTLSDGTLVAASDNALGTQPVMASGGKLFAADSRIISNAITVAAAPASETPYTVTYNFATATPSATTGTGYTASAVTQNNNLGSTTLLTSTSPSDTYSGASAGNNAGAAARTGALITGTNGSAFFEFSITSTAGTITLSAVSFGTRSTGTGPQLISLVESSDLTTTVASNAVSNTGTWAQVNPSFSTLSSASLVPLTLRLYGSGGTGSASSNTANWRIDDLVLAGTLTSIQSTVTLGSDITSGVATFAGPITLNSDVQLSAASGGTTSFTGSIANGIGSNTVIITGAGTSKVIFNSLTPNAFAPTLVNVASGTLLLGAADQIADSTNLKLSGGTFNTGGFSETLGTLTLSADSVLDFGSSDLSVLHFADSSALGWTNSLIIQNWNGVMDVGGGSEALFFGSTLAGLNSGQLAQISFLNPSGQTGLFGAGINEGGEVFAIVPVPEPLTILSASLMLGLIGYREHRRMVRTPKLA